MMVAIVLAVIQVIGISHVFNDASVMMSAANIADDMIVMLTLRIKVFIIRLIYMASGLWGIHGVC